MKHYALKTEYIGNGLHGWQEQDNDSSVQGELQKAWQRISGEEIKFRGCSRTDAGVSARAHVADFYTNCPIPYQRIPQVLNTFLPEKIAVKEIREVPEDFDARRKACGKLYFYRIYNSSTRSAFGAKLLCQVKGKLDIENMRDLATRLEGEHDFTAFMDQGSVLRRPVRRLDRLDIIEDPHSPLITIVCMAPAFLYHQVRILAGTLVYAGQDKLKASEVFQAIAEKNRKPLGKTMPPEGLCLEKVFYPQIIFSNDSKADYEALVKAPLESFQTLASSLF